MNTLRRILTGTALAVVSAALAGATTTGYTAITPTGSGTGGSGFDNTDFSYSLSLPKFDATLGTLTGVTLYFYVEEHTTALNFRNTGGGNSNFNISVQSQINSGGLVNSLDGSGDTLCTDCLNDFSQEVLTLLNTGSQNLGPSGLGNCAFATPSTGCDNVDYANSSNIIVKHNNVAAAGNPRGTGVSGVFGQKRLVGNNDIANYIGAGNFTLSGLTLAQTVILGGGGNIQLNQATKAEVKTEVDYTYTPLVTSATPEPTTMILFGSALVGLGFMRRKK
jgi:hypothetical protein